MGKSQLLSCQLIKEVLRIVVNFTTIALVFLFFSVYTYSLKTNKTINRIESNPLLIKYYNSWVFSVH